MIRLVILAVLAGLLAGGLTAVAIYGPEAPASWLAELDADALADRRLFLAIAVLVVLLVVAVDVIRRRRRRRRQ